MSRKKPEVKPDTDWMFGDETTPKESTTTPDSEPTQTRPLRLREAVIRTREPKAPRRRSASFTKKIEEEHANAKKLEAEYAEYRQNEATRIAREKEQLASKNAQNIQHVADDMNGEIYGDNVSEDIVDQVIAALRANNAILSLDKSDESALRALFSKCADLSKTRGSEEKVASAIQRFATAVLNRTNIPAEEESLVDQFRQVRDDGIQAARATPAAITRAMLDAAKAAPAAMAKAAREGITWTTEKVLSSYLKNPSKFPEPTTQDQIKEDENLKREGIELIRSFSNMVDVNGAINALNELFPPILPGVPLISYFSTIGAGAGGAVAGAVGAAAGGFGGAWFGPAGAAAGAVTGARLGETVGRVGGAYFGSRIPAEVLRDAADIMERRQEEFFRGRSGDTLRVLGMVNRMVPKIPFMRKNSALTVAAIAYIGGSSAAIRLPSGTLSLVFGGFMTRDLKKLRDKIRTEEAKTPPEKIYRPGTPEFGFHASTPRAFRSLAIGVATTAGLYFGLPLLGITLGGVTLTAAVIGAPLIPVFAGVAMVGAFVAQVYGRRLIDTIKIARNRAREAKEIKRAASQQVVSPRHQASTDGPRTIERPPFADTVARRPSSHRKAEESREISKEQKRGS